MSLSAGAIGAQTVAMAVIMVMVGMVGFGAAGFVGWYAMWHRRVAASLELVPVAADGAAPVVRRDGGLPGESIR